MYVSNLATHVNDSSLRQLFEQYGQVSSSKVIIDRQTGQSRGFGFVIMDSGAEAEQAMSQLNGKEVEGRAISVTVAREKQSW